MSVYKIKETSKTKIIVNEADDTGENILKSHQAEYLLITRGPLPGPSNVSWLRQGSSVVVKYRMQFLNDLSDIKSIYDL